MSCAQHLQYPCTYHARLTESQNKLWTVVGEWSLATPGQLNCGSQDVFARQQIAAFEKGSGWIMWAHNHAQNWREWSYKHSHESNWINPRGNNYAQC